MFCSNCGKQIEENKKFCCYCGTPIQRQDLRDQGISMEQGTNETLKQEEENQEVRQQVRQEERQEERQEARQEVKQEVREDLPGEQVTILDHPLHHSEPKQNKKGKKWMILVSSLIGTLILVAILLFGIRFINHKNALSSFKEAIAGFETYYQSNTLGIYDEDYHQLLLQSKTVIEKKQYSKMDELVESLENLKLQVGKAQEEVAKITNIAIQYQSFTNDYKIPTMYEEEYKKKCEMLEQQLQRLDAESAKNTSSELDTMVKMIKEINREFEGYINQFDTYRIAGDELIFSKEQERTYQQYIDEYNTAIQDMDQDACKTVNDLLTEYMSLLTAASKEIVSNSKNDVISLYSSALYQLLEPEVEQSTLFEKEVEQLCLEEKYRSAKAKIDEWYIYLVQKAYPTAFLQLSQVDMSEYPLVKLYLNFYDDFGETIKISDYSLFIVKEKLDEATYVDQEILKASILDEMENLNVNLVADVSGSMQDQFYTVMNVMKNFLNTMQFNIGDKASIISFSDEVDANISFTNDYNRLVTTIDDLTMGNMTALYDALYVAILQTAQQNGAKCIMAFTDGQDNVSSCSRETIIELANRYHIPIYIIGIGSGIDAGSLELIATSTGGYYHNVYDVWDMQDIYNDIFRKQKELYFLEYKTQLPEDQLEDNVSVYVDYNGEDIAASTEFTFVPGILLEAVTSHAYDIDGFVFGDSDSRYLTAADLEGLTKEELRIARNEIYARRGRKFKDQMLQDYFNSQSWYVGTIAPDEFSEDYFNDYEKANAYFIKDYERLHGFIQ